MLMCYNRLSAAAIPITFANNFKGIGNIIHMYDINMVRGPGELFLWHPLVASLLRFAKPDILSKDDISTIQSVKLEIFSRNSADIFPVPQTRDLSQIDHLAHTCQNGGHFEF